MKRRDTRDCRGDIQKARAIYEWVVDNTSRDPKTPGCGMGDVASTRSEWAGFQLIRLTYAKSCWRKNPAGWQMSNPKVQAARTALFGGWEMNWVAYNHGHDIALPGSGKRRDSVPDVSQR